MALAEKPGADGLPRRILEVNSDKVFEGGVLVDDPSGNVWIERRQKRLSMGLVRHFPGREAKQ
jgi:hypothetical protein